MQREVAATLTELGAQVQGEKRIQEGYSIDAVGLWEDEWLAVLVDGPSHFVHAGGGHSPTGPTLLKRRQLRHSLRALGWRLVVVPYWEWGKLTTGEAKHKYLLHVLKRAASGRQSPSKENGRKWQRQGQTHELMTCTNANQLEKRSRIDPLLSPPGLEGDELPEKSARANTSRC